VTATGSSASNRARWTTSEQRGAIAGRRPRICSVARLSELNLSIYRTFAQPFVRALAVSGGGTRPDSESAQTQLHDFCRRQSLDERRADARRKGGSRSKACRCRQPIHRAADDGVGSDHSFLDAYRMLRDQWAEHMFFGFYGAPFVQALLGIRSVTRCDRFQAFRQKSLRRDSPAWANMRETDEGGSTKP